jgi:spore coat protein U-like protein
MSIVRRWLLPTFLGLIFCTTVEARTCLLSQVQTTAFGTYIPMQAGPLDTTSTISVQCFGRRLAGQSRGYTISIWGGNSGNDATNRFLLSGTNQLPYNLYRRANRAPNQIWGNGSNGGRPVGRNIGNRRNYSRTHTVYGRIPALQDPASGFYSDIVNVEIAF